MLGLWPSETREKDKGPRDLIGGKPRTQLIKRGMWSLSKVTISSLREHLVTLRKVLCGAQQEPMALAGSTSFCILCIPMSWNVVFNVDEREREREREGEKEKKERKKRKRERERERERNREREGEHMIISPRLFDGVLLFLLVLMINKQHIILSY